MRLCAWILMVFALFPTSVLARQWTDTTGKYHREAEFVGLEGSNVLLEDAAGNGYAIELARLSSADRGHVASLGRSAKSERVFRLPNMVRTAEASDATSHTRVAANISMFKLTGWHCHDGHCYTESYYHHPHHPTPCPQPPDKGKRILKGWHSRFHLVTQDSGPEYDGTAAFQFTDRSGCCHTYLDMLKYISGTTTTSMIYEDINSASSVHFWWFGNFPGTYDYTVYYSTTGSGGPWYYYDTTCGKSAE